MGKEGADDPLHSAEAAVHSAMHPTQNHAH